MSGMLAYLLLFVQGAKASDDWAWAIPKPDLLRSDMSIRAGAVQKPLPESLSVRKPYIVGGTTTTRGEYPEYTLLWVDGLDGYIYAICGASLIDYVKV
ncbi:MAG: hypothetical protein U9Q71_08365, partial [Pseudomonadota bacterium]|nr:hypothetical protein [Pseudomonadota bacterium]